ncbi:hypothetical protein MBLNU459_g3925t1 [Dothideomycetes sp. NU459]
MSRFEGLDVCPLDEAFALTAEFNADQNENKINLGAGVYRTNDSKPWVLPVVQEAKNRLHEDTSVNHEYLPIHGSNSYLDLAQSIVLGRDLKESVQSRLSSIQAIGGTGANYLAGLFLAHHLKPQNVWIPTPTWNNHNLIWEIAAPQVQRKSYPHYDATDKTFAFEAMLKTLKESLDPSKAQWSAIKQLCADLRLFVVFDLAYQGFASGDLESDAWAVRHFASDPSLELAICQSFSKNFGLYGERVGALHLLTAEASSAVPGMSHLVRLQRAAISNPGQFGARVVALVLADSVLYTEWLSNMKTMSGRVVQMRLALRDELIKLGTPGSWDHIVEQIGMFSFTGLSPSQVRVLKEKHHVYLMENGRASICGLTTRNVKYVAKAMYNVVTSETKNQT